MNLKQLKDILKLNKYKVSGNKEDLINLGLKEAKIRYKNLTQTMIIKLEEEE